MTLKILTEAPGEPPRNLSRAMARGACRRCPACGKGRLYRGYLKVVAVCGHCGEALHHQRADDAPAYFVILVVGHLVGGLALSIEAAYRPDIWVHWAVLLPLALMLCLVGLPTAKGALIGLQWAFRMHGFGGEAEAPATGAGTPTGGRLP